MTVLAGDIGGTHARLALFDLEEGAVPALREHRTVASGDHPGLAPIVRAFLERLDGARVEAIEGVCLAMAGPVKDGTCRLPNLGWTVEEEALGEAIGFPGVRLLNDFEAVGHGVLALGPDACATLQEGQARPRAPMVVVGPGTGLGQGFLLWEGDRYQVHPSEGGHADFAPRTRREWALAHHLRAKYGHASWERVVSGPGLAETYRFLADSGFSHESPEVRTEMDEGDPTEVVARLGLEGSDPICREALEIFVSALGAQAGNLVLTFEAEGGVYLAGGMAPRLLEALRGSTFMEAFRRKGRLSRLVEDVPVRVVLDERVGLKGAARVAAGRD